MNNPYIVLQKRNTRSRAEHAVTPESQEFLAKS